MRLEDLCRGLDKDEKLSKRTVIAERLLCIGSILYLPLLVYSGYFVKRFIPSPWVSAVASTLSCLAAAAFFFMLLIGFFKKNLTSVGDVKSAAMACQ